MLYSQELYLVVAIVLLGGVIHAQMVDPPGLGGPILGASPHTTPPSASGSGITVPQASVPSALGGTTAAVPPSVQLSPGNPTPSAALANAGTALTGNGGPILNGIQSPF